MTSTPTKNTVVGSTATRGAVARVNSFGGGEKCRVCQKTVYLQEKVVAGGDLVFHDNCFKCATCAKKLTSSTYSSHEGKVYCSTHGKEQLDRLNAQAHFFSDASAVDSSATVTKTPTAGAATILQKRSSTQSSAKLIRSSGSGPTEGGSETPERKVSITTVPSASADAPKPTLPPFTPGKASTGSTTTTSAAAVAPTPTATTLVKPSPTSTTVPTATPVKTTTPSEVSTPKTSVATPAPTTTTTAPAPTTATSQPATVPPTPTPAPTTTTAATPAPSKPVTVTPTPSQPATVTPTPAPSQTATFAPAPTTTTTPAPSKPVTPTPALTATTTPAPSKPVTVTPTPTSTATTTTAPTPSKSDTITPTTTSTTVVPTKPTPTTVDTPPTTVSTASTKPTIITPVPTGTVVSSPPVVTKVTKVNPAFDLLTTQKQVPPTPTPSPVASRPNLITVPTRVGSGVARGGPAVVVGGATNERDPFMFDFGFDVSSGDLEYSFDFELNVDYDFENLGF